MLINIKITDQNCLSNRGTAKIDITLDTQNLTLGVAK